MKWLREGSITDRSATALLALLAMGVCGNASAACSVNGESDTIAPWATLTVNGAAIGRPVSPWLQGTRNTDYFAGCAMWAFKKAVVTGVQTQVRTYTEGGEVYGVYETGVAGLGIVIGMRDEEYPARPNYVPIHSTQASWVEFDGWFNPDVRVRYIRTGDIPLGTYTTNGFRFAAGTIDDGGTPVPALFKISGATITTRHRPLCRPEATTVRMGSVPVTDFDGQYSGSRSRAFQVFLNCEAGVGDVSYFLEQTDVSPMVDRERGIVAVSGGATGVGLQMLEQSDGRPIALDSVKAFGSSTTPGRISRQFFARYVQTAEKVEDVVLGQANAAIRIVMEYP